MKNKKNIIILIILLIPQILIAGNISKDILFNSLKSVRNINCTRTQRDSILFLEALAHVNFEDSNNALDNIDEIIPNSVDLVELNLTNNYSRFQAKIYPTYRHSRLDDVKLVIGNAVYIYNYREPSLISTIVLEPIFINSNINALNKNYSIKEEYKEVKLLDKDCLLVEVKDLKNNYLIKYWIEKEKNIIIKRETYTNEGVLINRKKALSFIKLNDNSYFENIIFSWNINNPSDCFMAWIIDLKEGEINKELYDKDILIKYASAID